MKNIFPKIEKKFRNQKKCICGRHIRASDLNREKCDVCSLVIKTKCKDCGKLCLGARCRKCHTGYMKGFTKVMRKKRKRTPLNAGNAEETTKGEGQ